MENNSSKSSTNELIRDCSDLCSEIDFDDGYLPVMFPRLFLPKVPERLKGQSRSLPGSLEKLDDISMEEFNRISKLL